MNSKIEVLPKATYSTKEVSLILGVTDRTIQRVVSAGKIKYSILGNKRIFWGEDILNYLNSIKK